MKLNPAGLSLLAALALAIAAPAQAVSLAIANAGFESPSLGDTDFTSNTLPGWTGTDSSSAIWNFGAYNPPTGYFPGQAPEGFNVAYIERGAIYQTLGDVLVAQTDYSLSVWVGDSLANTLPGFAVQLRAGGTVLAESTGPAPANGSFERVSLGFSSGAAHAQLGQALQIWLIETDPAKSSEAFFDDVRLSAIPSAVPEPSAAVLALAGLALLGYTARRRAA